MKSKTHRNISPPQHKADLTYYSLKNEIDFSSSIFESGDCGDCPRPPSSSLNPFLLFPQQSAANSLIFSCDSSSLPDNVGLSVGLLVGWSVGQSVRQQRVSKLHSI